MSKAAESTGGENRGKKENREMKERGGRRGRSEVYSGDGVAEHFEAAVKILLLVQSSAGGISVDALERSHSLSLWEYCGSSSISSGIWSCKSKDYGRRGSLGLNYMSYYCRSNSRASGIYSCG